MNTTPNIPISLDSVEINNFRLFGELTASLHSELTVFIAPNSGGKTAILDAIAMLLSSLLRSSAPNWQPSDMRKASIKVADTTSYEIQTPNWIKLNIAIENFYLNSFPQESSSLLDSLVQDDGKQRLSVLGSHSPQGANAEQYPEVEAWTQSGTSKAFGSSVAKTLSQSIKQAITNGGDEILPLMAYFLANRRVSKSSSLNTTQNFDISRLPALLTLLNCSDIQNFDDWLRERAITGLETRLEMEENGETKISAPDAHLQAVSTVLALMLENEVGVKTVKYFSSSKSIQAIKDNGERFNIDQLSHGAKSVLMIAAKLAMHCCALNPHLHDKAPAQTPGIILIDEIDLHLHPRWQQHVIDDLRRCFPKMQFIISTHSPAVLSTVKKENIREIKVDYATGKCTATEPLVRSYGESIADTLETIMGVPARPDNDLVQTLNQYLNWAENGDLSEMKDEQRIVQRTELEKELGKDHADLLTADLIIRRREILAENE